MIIGGEQVQTFDICYHTKTLELAKTVPNFKEMVIRTSMEAVQTALQSMQKNVTLHSSMELSFKYYLVNY